MLHDHVHPHFNNAYISAVPRDDSPVLLFHGEAVAMEEGLQRFPRIDTLPDKHQPLQYLFSLEGSAYFLSSGQDLPPGCCWVPLREVRFNASKGNAFVAGIGHQLSMWYLRHQFCGACGQATQHAAAERMLFCPSCGQVYYPTLNPAVIVGIINGNKLLVTRIKGRPSHHQALVAGYAEAGETLEETVRREVWEETGLKVTDITYYKSQPWGFSSSLLVGYYARLEGSDIINPQDEELESAFWVDRDALTLPFDGISLTNEMITRFALKGSEGLLRPQTPPFTE